MSDQDSIQILEQKRVEKQMTKTKSTVVTIFVLMFAAVILVVSNFIGKHFFNVVLFLFMFTFPLLIIYKVEIVQLLPAALSKSLIDASVDAVSEIQGKSEPLLNNINSYTQSSAGILYQRELHMLLLGTICVIFSGFTFYSRILKNAAKLDLNTKRDIVALITFMVSTIMGIIFINDLF
jgi:hypothetical protein